MLKRDTAELEKAQAKLSEVEKQLDKPFAQQEEMEKTRQRLEEINAEINSGTSQEQQSVSNENVTDKKSSTTAKNSQTSDGSTATNNLVDNRNLTDQHKLLQQLGNAIGANVVFFNNYNRDFHGAYEGGTIYLNVNSARSLTTTFAHELFHFLKANNPKLFSEMAKAAGITETQLANYLTETKRTDVTENADVTEEVIADAMQQILSRVAKKDKSLVQRFLAWLKDTFQKFKDLFQNPKGKLTRGQYANLADTFGKMAVKLTDADGNKIFRYNTRTHNLELANGESLETLLDNTEIENESSDEQGFFNLDGLSLAGAKFSRASVDANTGVTNATEFSEQLTQQNIERGRAAIERVIQTHEDVRSAMNRPDIGDIDILWGYEGDPNRQYRNGYGISHIIARRNLQGLNGEEVARLMPEIIMRGEKRQGINENRIEFHYNNYIAVLSNDMNGESVPHWLLTGFMQNETEPTNQRGEGFDSSAPTARTPTLARSTRAASSVSERSIPQAPERRNSEGDTGTRYSIGSSSNSQTSTNTESEGTVRKWFNGITQKISRALHIDGDRIVTAETAAKRLRAEREKAMDDYIKNPSKENLRRLKELKISRLMLDAYKKGEEYVNDLTLSDMYRRSPSRIAEKVSAFRAYFRMGDKAMDKLVRLRDRFTVGLNAAMDFLKNKDDNDALTNLLIDGDANEIEYGVLTEQEKDSIKASTSPENVTKKLQQARIQKICAETGVSENIAKAYVKIRQLMTQAYHMLNDAKRRPQIKSKHCSDAEISALKNNKFVTITRISDNTDENGNRLVTYKRYAHTEKKYTVTESVLDRFKKDNSIQVVKATVKGIENSEKIYYVEVREGIAELTNRRGYVPHLFQEYMIRVKDKDGKIVERFGYGGVIGSGRTQVEAVKIAEEWQKKNPNTLKDGEEIYIAPKIANFKELGMDEKNYAPIMGDKDFDSMVHNIA